MISPSVLRVAGPQLANYLKLVGSRLSDVAGKAGSKVAERLAASNTLQTIGAGTAEEAASAIGGIPRIGGVLSNLPLSVSAYQKVAPHIPAAAGIATEMALLSGVPAITTGLAKTYGTSEQPFSQQQYIPGQLPLSNYQAAESMLAGQRYRQQMELAQQARLSDAYRMRNQLALLQARQGGRQGGPGVSGMIDLNENMFATPVGIYE